jgi:molecular chaperone HtpG
MEEKGSISIHTENIFPIIKKFLYSDHEIFLRELVSNAVDATQKLKRLASLGEFPEEVGDTQVVVSFNENTKTISILDKGIGMTADEVKKYINQIAFSGATEFIEKYKDKAETQDIIGKFGLGFYSAFMVASKVELISRSYQKEAEAIRWECDGSTEFVLTNTVKKERGTEVILHMAEDSLEFLDKNRIKGILDKYCKFLPVEIVFDGSIINNTQPLWTKAPSELKDEDYLGFYKELYPFTEDPLFWIHLNVDYPFNLTGILYFPKIKKDIEPGRNKIQLYSRQVFITDEVKDVVPEYLMLLHGVLDSPDIPLNVSRSFLQADSNVKKINSHITKKVADKLQELFKSDRASFESKFADIGLFVKYGMLTDDKFYDRAKDFILLKNLDQKYFTLEEYQTHVKPLQTDKESQVIYLYAHDPARQDSFIAGARRNGYDVLLMDDVLDSHFVGLLERKLEKTQFKRVDSDPVHKLISKQEEAHSLLSQTETEALKKRVEEVIQQKNYQVSVEPMPEDELPMSLVMPEFMRRMKEMAAGGGMAFMGTMPDTYQLIVNANHPLIRQLVAQLADEKSAVKIQQLFDLALLGQGMLTGAALTGFIERSISLVGIENKSE